MLVSINHVSCALTTLKLGHALKMLFTNFLHLIVIYICICVEFKRVKALDVKLLVDGKEVSLNRFVAKFLGNTIAGAVSALRDVKEDWREIRIEIKRGATV